MDDLLDIKQNIDNYILELEEGVDVLPRCYQYKSFNEVRVFTSKGWHKERKRFLGFHYYIHCGNIIKENMDGFENDLEVEMINPPEFLIKIRPICRRLIKQKYIPINWDSKTLPEQCDAEYIELPYKEYFIREQSIYSLMTRKINRFVYNFGNDNIIVKIKNSVTIDLRKLNGYFEDLFDRLGLHVPFSHFESFYQTKVLRCADYINSNRDDDSWHQERLLERREIDHQKWEIMKNLKWK